MIGFIFLFMGRLAGDPLSHDLWSLIDSLTGVIRLIKQTFSIDSCYRSWLLFYKILYKNI